MPSQLSYPGVYVEEVSSGVRTIIGVATSITAFVGRTARGRENEATTITSYADFDRRFGGLDANSPVSYAVRDFFLNGGSRAVIVRLFRGEAGKTPKAPLTLGTSLTLEAASSGAWGQNLRGEIDFDVTPDSIKAAGLTDTPWQLFDLTLKDATPGGAVETCRNVTMADLPNRLDRVLKQQSDLARWTGKFDQATLEPDLKVGKDAIQAVADATSSDALLAAHVALAAVRVRDAVSEAEAGLDTAGKNLRTLLAAAKPDPAAIAKARSKTDDAATALTAAKKAREAAASDGLELQFGDYVPATGEDDKTGLYALDKADLINLLCLPTLADPDKDLLASAVAYCVTRRAMLIVDPPSSSTWKNANAVSKDFRDPPGFPGLRSRDAALYFPRVNYPDPKNGGQIGEFPPCGVIAGVFAKTDATRGVWKAPAGLDAGVLGIRRLAVNLTDNENGLLNPLGINCLRFFPAGGNVVWGSRTLRGDDGLADEYKYVPVRRLALFLEESLYRGTQWTVFEPNDEPLWAQLRLNVGAFMHDLFRQGAFAGSSPSKAYLVKCDKETTTQSDVNRGVVNVLIGFAPLKPAEFVVLQIQQLAGQIDT